jgi:hypothetical protein
MLRLLPLVVVLALVGCGSEGESSVDKTFGGVSGSDEQLIQDVAAEVRKFSTNYTDLIASFNSEDVGGARTAVEAMDDHITKAADTAAKAENENLRKTYDDYLGTMEEVTTVAERVVTYLEDPGKAKPAAENKLVKEFQTAVKAAEKADREFLDRLAENASPEEREALEKQYRDAQRQFEEETGNDAGGG